MSSSLSPFFNPRGVVSFGYLLAGPRMMIDRLDQEYFAVDPQRNRPDRWPLLPLADWAAGKIPICVTHEDGRVTIEGEIEPVEKGAVEEDVTAFALLGGAGDLEVTEGEVADAAADEAGDLRGEGRGDGVENVRVG